MKPMHILYDEASHALGIDIIKVAREAPLEWYVEQEQAAGLEFGPVHEDLLRRRAPEQVQKILAEMERTRHVELLASSQGFGDMPLRDYPPADLRAAIASTTTETQLWNPAIHASLPVGSIRGGKSWTLRFGGIIGTTGTPTLIGNTRVGTDNSAPPTGTSLGASSTVTLPTIAAPVSFMGMGDYGCRSNGVAASGATINGHAVIFIPAAAAATVTPHILCGGTPFTTCDETVTQGLGVSITWGASSASNTCTPRYVKHIFDN